MINLHEESVMAYQLYYSAGSTTSPIREVSSPQFGNDLDHFNHF